MTFSPYDISARGTEQDGWIEHDGKGMPVAGDIKVSVKFRDGGYDNPQRPWPAKEWGINWEHDEAPHPADIIAYRIVGEG